MKFFNFTKINIKPGEIYAVHKGVYLGHLLFYIEHNKHDDLYCFLSIKGLKNICIPSKDVKEGIKGNLLRKTTIKLPTDFRTLCLKQYKFNIDNPKNDSIIKEDENFDIGLQ